MRVNKREKGELIVNERKMDLMMPDRDCDGLAKQKNIQTKQKTLS